MKDWQRPCEKCGRPIVKTTWNRTCVGCFEPPPDHWYQDSEAYTGETDG